MAKVTGLKVGFQSGSGNTVYATWAFSKTNVDYYQVKWTYYVGGVGFSGEPSRVTAKQATYSVPSNAKKVKASVKPVSKTHDVVVNNKTVKQSYWSGEYVSNEYDMAKSPPATPSAPSVSVSNYKLTAILDSQDSNTDGVEFYIITGNTKFKSAEVALNKTSRRASYTCNISAGAKYRVRCRAFNQEGSLKGSGAISRVYSGWSEYSGEVLTKPSGMAGVKCVVASKTSVKVSWDKNSTASSYEVEYTKNKSYFGSSSEVSSLSVTTPYAYVTGLESGNRYYFRVRAVNSEGESAWSPIVGTVLGTKPEAPTTWSSTTTVVAGERVTLYWVHNCEDGSEQTGVEIELAFGFPTKSVVGLAKESSYNFDPRAFVGDGSWFSWRARTKGITNEYGPWSVERMVKIYAPPTLGLDFPDVLEFFPFRVNVRALPDNQQIVGCHFSVIAEETHESTDATGSPIWVNAGEEVYSKNIDAPSHYFSFDLLAGDVYLENNQSYRVVGTAAMDSGLTAMAEGVFGVSWADRDYDPDASIAIVWDTLTACISPFCRDVDDNLVGGVTLSVYRREYDGGFTELATGLANDGCATITDPYPSLDYARYRVVARDNATGQASFEDLPGEPVLEHSIVVQWDGAWTAFNYNGGDGPEIPPWSGSMLKLPWNVDVSEKYGLDVAMVEYAGRKHPVSYYGTQRGESATWSADIEKSDKETLYALRRLAAWPGDVYVREPSGVGYWANVTVSMSINHKELVVPVTLEVRHVEHVGMDGVRGGVYEVGVPEEDRALDGIYEEVPEEDRALGGDG